MGKHTCRNCKNYVYNNGNWHICENCYWRKNWEEKTTKKVYLAAPWFRAIEKTMYTAILQQMREDGYEVYAPKEHELPNAWDMPNEEWAKKVFEADVKAIKDCDEVWALNFGMYSDSGTAWECGFAYGIGKPVKQILCGLDGEEYSLMMINGCNDVDLEINYLVGTHVPLCIEQK